MDGLERRGLRPRTHNRDVRVQETRRIRDVPFEERCSGSAQPGDVGTNASKGMSEFQCLLGMTISAEEKPVIERLREVRPFLNVTVPY